MCFRIECQSLNQIVCFFCGGSANFKYGCDIKLVSPSGAMVVRGEMLYIDCPFNAGATNADNGVAISCPNGKLKTGYNADVTATGVDSAFGRAHKISQVGEPPAIDNAPFFAWKTTNVNYGTMGGLKVNLDQQVIDVFGDPIPGLYCAGTICTYAQMGAVPASIKGVGASGTGFGGSVIWGRYAVQRINELEA